MTGTHPSTKTAQTMGRPLLSRSTNARTGVSAPHKHISRQSQRPLPLRLRSGQALSQKTRQGWGNILRSRPKRVMGLIICPVAQDDGIWNGRETAYPAFVPATDVMSRLTNGVVGSLKLERLVIDWSAFMVNLRWFAFFVLIGAVFFGAQWAAPCAAQNAAQPTTQPTSQSAVQHSAAPVPMNQASEAQLKKTSPC